VNSSIFFDPRNSSVSVSVSMTPVSPQSHASPNQKQVEAAFCILPSAFVPGSHCWRIGVALMSH
jgi:hypothetical protein